MQALLGSWRPARGASSPFCVPAVPLGMQVGALRESGVSFCPAETPWAGIQVCGALGCFPLPRWEDRGTVGLLKVTPWGGAVVCAPHPLTSEIAVTVIAAIYLALSVLQAPLWGLWPWDQFLCVGLVTPF